MTMTKDEAIAAVKEVTGMSLPWNDRHYAALQMAIKALEQPAITDPCTVCKWADEHPWSVCEGCKAEGREE